MSSPLDAWAVQNYQVPADMLMPDDMVKLYDHMRVITDADVKYWKPRDDRFLESQLFWEIGNRKGGTKNVKTGTRDEAEDIQQAEVVELNDGYLVVDKITSMVAGAGWYVDVPPKEVELQDAAQDIEDFLHTVDEELNDRHGMALNASLLRDQVHYAALRGWITGMILPNPEDAEFPFTEVLEDPLLVYPRFSRDKLIRVTYRYKLSMLEAMDEFPVLMNQPNGGYREEEEVEVTDYFDDKYRCTFVTGAVGNVPTVGGYTVVRPLVAHGYVDVQGKPINPWIIVTPRGTPTRRSQAFGTAKDTVRYIGLDVLHPIKELIMKMEKLASVLATEVEKGTNPPRIIWYDGVNKPEPLDVGVGGENYFLIGQQDAKILESSAMKPDANPYMQIIGERLQKGGLPSVLYGESGGAVAGYAINLLSQGARDVLEPIMDGVKLFRKLRFRRMLEMYYTHGSMISGPMPFRSRDRSLDMEFTGSKSLDPSFIAANGVQVDVRYDELTPRDKVGLMGAAVAGVQAGLLPVYDAMKDWLGLKDPRQALQRLAEGLNYKDPEVMNELKILAGQKSGSGLLKEALQRVLLKRMAMLQQGVIPGMPPSGGAGGGNGPRPPMANGTEVPPIEQVNGTGAEPANVSPLNAAANQLNDVSSMLSGGTPPMM